MVMASPACFRSVLLFPVDRNEIFGTGQGLHQLQFLLAGMAGNMHLVHGFVNNGTILLQQLIYHAPTVFSLPGMGRAEMMMKSLGSMATFR